MMLFFTITQKGVHSYGTKVPKEFGFDCSNLNG